MPDKLRVSVADGPWRKTLYYNSKRFVLFDQGQRYYAALYINDQEVDGQLCAHYAYRQPGVDWPLWVHL